MVAGLAVTVGLVSGRGAGGWGHGPADLTRWTAIPGCRTAYADHLCLVHTHVSIHPPRPTKHQTAPSCKVFTPLNVGLAKGLDSTSCGLSTAMIGERARGRGRRRPPRCPQTRQRAIRPGQRTGRPRARNRLRAPAKPTSPAAPKNNRLLRQHLCHRRAGPAPAVPPPPAGRLGPRQPRAPRRRSRPPRRRPPPRQDAPLADARRHVPPAALQRAVLLHAGGEERVGRRRGGVGVCGALLLGLPGVRDGGGIHMAVGGGPRRARSLRPFAQGFAAGLGMCVAVRGASRCRAGAGLPRALPVRPPHPAPANPQPPPFKTQTKDYKEPGATLPVEAASGAKDVGEPNGFGAASNCKSGDGRHSGAITPAQARAKAAAVAALREGFAAS